VLTHVLLPAPNPNDLAGLELAQREAEAVLALAQRDRDRAERLVKTGAAPAKRLDEAQTNLALAGARLQAAQARLAQLSASQRAEGSGGLRPFAIKAPISGIVHAVKSAPGANVNPGDPIVEIIDPDSVYVSAIVPESEFPRMRALHGAELEIPGSAPPRPLTRLITVGRVVDAPSRTFPVIYEFDNRERLIAINQTVHVRLLLSAGGAGPVIPESALVDDGGRPIVFVQTGGESFERRPVKTGARQAGQVQILQGIQSGERVVTKGAHLIRLASLSGQVPAHGHVH
jgi:RND family efflux transporter MFP subunit